MPEAKARMSKNGRRGRRGMGGRGVGGGLIYTTCKAAARYGANVARETTESAIAYAKIHAALPRSRFVKYRKGWLRETE